MNTFTTSLAPKRDLFSDARVRYVQRVAIFSIVASVFGLFAIVTADMDTTDKLMRFSLTSIFPLLNIGLLVLAHRGQARLASSIIILEFTFGSLLAASATLYWVVFAAMLAVTAAATLADKWLYRLVNIVITGQFIATFIVIGQSTSDFNQILPYMIVLLTVLIVSGTTRYFTSQIQTAAAAARSSNSLLQVAAEAGQVLGKLLTLKDVLPSAVDFIQERFGYYHVQIFLIDEDGKDAELVVSTGEVGRQLVARQHSLPVGSQSVIGRTTASGQSVIARDTDSTYYRNELLPNTRSELALPIFDGDKIIGALDVQSREYEVFGDEVMQALQVVANLLGTTIRNVRLFENQEKNTREMRQLFLDSESSLREIQRLNRQLTRDGWQEYLGSHQQINGITFNDERAVMDSQWTDALLKAGRIRQPVLEKRGEHGVIAVPMMLGNEVIGAIEVEADNSIQRGEITELVKAVAQRLALSLDKARLFEESQETAAQEQRINEIVARFQTVNNVDDLLRITLEEVSQSLGAKRGIISLSSASPGSANGERQV